MFVGQFPYSNAGTILSKLRPSLESKKSEVIDALAKADVSGMKYIAL